jgi:hypothetical protein
MHLDILNRSLKHFCELLQCLARLHGARAFARGGLALFFDATLEMRGRFAALRKFDRSNARVFHLRQSTRVLTIIQECDENEYFKHRDGGESMQIDGQIQSYSIPMTFVLAAPWRVPRGTRHVQCISTHTFSRYVRLGCAQPLISAHTRNESKRKRRKEANQRAQTARE